MSGVTRAAAVALALAAAAVLVTRTLLPTVGRIPDGFAAYYTASRALVEGRAGVWFYDDAVFRADVERVTSGRAGDIFWANPPTAALLLAPLAPLSAGVARAIWIAVSLVFLCLALGFLANRLARRDAAWFALPLLFVSAPVTEGLVHGQAYISLLALMAIAYLGLDRRTPRLAGAALGVAALLKLSGLPLWVLLAARREWRALAWGAGTCVAGVAASIPLVGVATWKTFVFRAVPSFLRDPAVAVTAYQTLPGFFRHLFRYDAAWNSTPIANWPLVAEVITAIAGLALLALAVARARTAPLAWTFAVGLILSTILVPAAEQHAYVLLFPALLLLLSRRPTPVYGIAAALVLVPLPYTRPLARGFGALLAYPRLYGALLLLALLFARDERRERSV